MSESKKKTFTDKEIIQALVRDLVQFAQQAQDVLRDASIPYSKLESAVILESMCKEVLERYIKDTKEKAKNESKDLSA